MADDGPQIPGVLRRVLGVFADVLEWLVATFEDPVLSEAIRADLGLDPDATDLPPVDDQRLASVRAFVDSTDPDAQSFAQVVEDVAAIAEAIGGWVDAARLGDDETEEILYLLLMLGATERLRIRSPLLFTLAETGVVLYEIFAAVPDASRSALGQALAPLWDAIKAVTRPLPEPLDVTPEVRFDEDDVTRLSHLIAIITTLVVEVTGLDDDVEAFYGWDHPIPASPSPVGDELLQRVLTVLVGDPEQAGARPSVTTALVPTEHGGPGMVVSLGAELTYEHVVPRALRAPPQPGEPLPAWAYRIGVAAGGLGLFIPFTGEGDAQVGADIAASFGLSASPVLATPSNDPAAPPNSFEDVRPAPRGVPAVRVGLVGSTLLEIGSFEGGFEFAPGRARAELRLRDVDLVLELGDADEFLRTQGDRRVLFGFDVTVVGDTETGLSFGAGSGFHVAIPVSRSIAGVFVAHQVELEIVPSDTRDGALVVAGTFGLRLGPVTAVVEGVGMRLDVGFGAGNLGLADVGIEFEPPRGVALAVEIGDLRGGGFLFHDPARAEYAGVLELAWGPVTVKAIGILTTRLPGGAPGWSLLVTLFGEFSPQPIGFGFFLTGVGGVVGIQHGVDTDGLRSGLRAGVLDAVLFPPDPVADAPRLLNQVRTIFPITPRALTVGPFLRLAYGNPALMTIQMGLILQLANVFRADDRDVELTRVVVVGQLKVDMPPATGRPAGTPVLVRILVDLLGDIDLQAGTLAIDARLRDSKLSGMTLTGSLVARARWGGEDNSWLVAVGGFHPDFTDLPPGLPKQDRVGLTMKKGIATVKFELYLAVTSNSFQVGARVFAQAKKWGFSVEGWLGFDALFEFDPFTFSVVIKAGVALKKGSRTLMGVDLELRASGPGRWNLAGKAKFKVLFISKTLTFDESWGSDPAVASITIDARAAIEAAFRDPASWSAALPATGEMLVSLRSPSPGSLPAGQDAVVAHPLGTLVGRQRVAPFGVTVDRVNGARPRGDRRFELTEVRLAGTVVPTGSGAGTRRAVTDHFATGQFLDLREDQRLSLPSFERHDAGVEIGLTDVAVPTTHVSATLDVETITIPRRDEPAAPPRTRLPIDMVVGQATVGAAARSRLRPHRFLADGPLARVSVRRPATVAVAGDDLRPSSRQPATPHGAVVRARQAVAAPVVGRTAGGAAHAAVGDRELAEDAGASLARLGGVPVAAEGTEGAEAFVVEAWELTTSGPSHAGARGGGR